MQRRGLRKNEEGMGIGDVWPVISIFGLIAIFMGVMIYVLSSMLPSLAVANSTTNETILGINESNVTTADANACGFSKWVVTAVWADYNQTNGTANGILNKPTGYNVSVSSANYTYYSNGHITNATSWVFPNASVSATFTGGGAACDATLNIMTQLISFIPWLGIILLVVAAAIVIGVLMDSFSGRRKRV